MYPTGRNYARTEARLRGNLPIEDSECLKTPIPKAVGRVVWETTVEMQNNHKATKL